MKLYSIRNLKATANWLDKRCFYCNEYFKLNDDIVLIIPSTELKVQYKKLSHNVIMHLYELNTLIAMYGEEGTIVQLAMHKAPKKALVLTEAQKNNLFAFRKACSDCGYTIETDAMRTESVYKRRKPGESLTFVYNPLTDKLSIRRRGNRGLLDGLFEHEMVASMFNRMHDIIGDGKIDNFSANKIISEAIDKANDLIK